MNSLAFLAHLISKRWTYFLALLVITLVLTQPQFVTAQPATGILAQLAQSTSSPQPEEEQDEEEEDEDEQTPTAEPNVEFSGAESEAESEQEDADTSTTVLPADDNGSFTLPYLWQGDATVSAQELAQVAPPLQAEVSQGDFQIAFVPAETGDVLRILPVPSADAQGALRLGMRLDESSTSPALPTDEVVTVQLRARVYAPDATTRILIADDRGSSSIVLEGVNWSDYQVTRHIAAGATALEVMLEWSQVPANGWLEIRGLNIAITPSAQSVALSPTDTPTPIGAEAVATDPPTATPTPTVPEVATATPLPRATPLPATDVPEPDATIEADEVISDVVLIPTPTFVVVTSTPTPEDVFEEATRVAQATAWASILGTVTPTPSNMATATPTLTPIIVVNSPTPETAGTATQVALLATAIAFTTGTPTPVPPDAIVLVATPTVPPPTNTPGATNTSTPVFVLLDEIPVTEPTVTPSVPPILYNKIVFLTAYLGNPRVPNAMVINPDGTGVGLLTTNFFYNAVAARDQYSADGRFYVYSLPEGGGEAHNTGLIQLFYDDTFYSSTRHQLTYFGAGVAWAPAWSPRSERIAFVSSESGNDEIWVAQRNQWPPMQLTENEWEWDHHPSFSPNGDEIVFSSNRGTGNRQLWLMDSGGGNQRQLTNFPFEAWDPVWVKYVGAPAEPTATPTAIPTAVPTAEITTGETTTTQTTAPGPAVCKKGEVC